MSRIRDLYKSEVKYASDDFVYETGKSLAKFKAAVKKDKPVLKQSDEQEHQVRFQAMGEVAMDMIHKIRQKTKAKQQSHTTVSYDKIIKAVVMV